jgi:DNA methylase
MKAKDRELRLAELRAKWRVCVGQRWRIPAASGGEHTVLCADSRSVLPPEGARTLFYDPPWDAESVVPSGLWASALVFTDGKWLSKALASFGTAVTWQFVWDCQCCLARWNRPFQRHKACLWYGDLAAYRWRGARLDPVPEKPRGKKLGELYAKPITAVHRLALHPREKPIEWVRCLVGNCAAGDVFDPYLGGGTSLLACEATGRRCFGVELDPKFVALTLERAEGAGLSPVLAQC